jgi:Cytochrome P460
MSGCRDYEQYDALALADLVCRRLVMPDELLDAAIDAVKRGQPAPSGTVITLVEYTAKLDDHGNPLRDASGRLITGEISRYIVMEKRTGWGAEYPPEIRNGEWEFQAFNADRSVNQNENLNRCFSCHKSRERQDFVLTFDQMKSVK